MVPVTGGDTLHVVEVWPDDNPHPEAIVFCHGAGGSHINWYHQAARFSITHRVILWDHRGFGSSTNSAGLASPTTAANDLKAVITTVVSEPAHIVAQSMGGWAALSFAAEHPDQVRSLTLSDTCAGLMSEKSVLRLKEFIDDAGATAETFYGSRAVGRQYGREQPAAAALYNLLTRALSSTYPDAVSDLISHPFHGDLQRLGGVPVLAIVGENDQIFPPEEVRRALGAVPDIRFAVIAGCGHPPYLESPTDYNSHLHEILNLH
jgi:pimeloyl-ACP methyl ester carboxylesterase